MHSHIYDVIVIGAGGMGSATAYHLAKSGARVLVLEQFNRGHTFGSSHGETRIIRFFYDKPFYTELMKTAYTEWRSLESESDKQLLFITGSINLGTKGNKYMKAVSESLNEAGVNYEWWDKKELTKRFLQFFVPDHYDILWQKDTGFLYASECVLTHLELSEQHGAIVRENTQVNRIEWQTDVPTIRTEKEQYLGRKIVVTAGAWTSSLLSKLDLPLTVTKQQVCYFKPTNTEMFRPNNYPVFTENTADDEFIYGIPYFGNNGAKVARHGLGKTFLPDMCEQEPDADYDKHINAFVKERIPSLGKVTHSEVCLYTETPDEDFIIDTHPDCPNVLIAAGFSGHGFKFCSLVGRIMCELALNDRTDFDISPFCIKRKVCLE